MLMNMKHTPIWSRVIRGTMRFLEQFGNKLLCVRNPGNQGRTNQIEHKNALLQILAPAVLQ